MDTEYELRQLLDELGKIRDQTRLRRDMEIQFFEDVIRRLTKLGDTLVSPSTVKIK